VVFEPFPTFSWKELNVQSWNQKRVSDRPKNDATLCLHFYVILFFKIWLALNWKWFTLPHCIDSLLGSWFMEGWFPLITKFKVAENNNTPTFSDTWGSSWLFAAKLTLYKGWDHRLIKVNMHSTFKNIFFLLICLHFLFYFPWSLMLWNVCRYITSLSIWCSYSKDWMEDNVGLKHNLYFYCDDGLNQENWLSSVSL
jgi:hypothetical protein